MRSQYRYILCGLIVVSWALGSCSSRKPTIGSPTDLNGRDPVEIICQIQETFKKLQKPVFTKINYYKPWTESKIVAGTSRYNQSFDIVLTTEAYQFIEKHSDIELKIALVPLIIDPENGADVLALFDGMEPRGKRRINSPAIPTYIIGKYRELPSTQKYLSKFYRYNKGHYNDEISHNKRRINKMKWDHEERLSNLLKGKAFLSIPYGYSSVDGTLESAILKIARPYFEVRQNTHGDWHRNKDWAAMTTIDAKPNMKFASILNMKPIVPTIGEKLKDFISENDKALTATTLLAIQDIYTLGIVLNLHEKYWIYYTTNWGDKNLKHSKAGRKYERQMKDEIVSTIYSYCNKQR